MKRQIIMTASTLATSLIFALLTLPSVASADEARCIVDASPNVDPDDALTVADFVCQEVRARGVDVAAPSQDETPSTSNLYRVKLRALGSATILTLSHEDAAGSVLRSEHLQLQDLDEVIVLGSRLATSITTNVPVRETATVTTLDHQETREHDKIPGELLTGISVEGTALFSPFVVAPGIGLHGVYEMPNAALVTRASFHFADGSVDAGAFGLAVGGRYLFSQTDTSFFAGGGLAWSGYYTDQQSETDDSGEDHEGMGLEAYAEAGVELFRFHSARVLFGARLSLPFYALEGYEYSSWENPDGTWDYAEDVTKSYVTPVTIGATVLW